MPRAVLASLSLSLPLFLCTLLPSTALSFSSDHCSRVIQSAVPTSGVVESPGYPVPYRAGLNCEFRISAAPSHVIHLTFLTFDLPDTHPSSAQCLDAYVVVVVIDRQGKEHVGPRKCGSLLPSSISTMQHQLRIEFSTTAAATRHRGFRIQYDIISEAAVREPPSFMEADADQFEGPCGGRSEAGQLTGEISSPGYPLTFPRNCTCNWLIRVQPRQRIYLRIIHFHLASTIAECERASITLLDGYKHEGSPERREGPSDTSEAKFCGSQLYYSEEGMKSYMSSGNRLIVRFVSNGPPSKSLEGNRLGFKVIWTAVEGLVDPVLSLSDPSSPDALSRQSEQCDQFICKGGQICVEQGHGVCVSRSQLCIHSSLVCDGSPNCVEGDFSDEQHCYSREIALFSLASLISLLSTILLCVCCDHWRKRRQLRGLIRAHRQQNGTKNDVTTHRQMNNAPHEISRHQNNYRNPNR